MTFDERMQVASLVLEYAKVAFGYSVTIPVLVAVLCLIFRSQIGATIGRIRKVKVRGVSVELGALAEYGADVKRSAQKVKLLIPRDEKVAEALTSFFSLSARLLPLIPKEDRQRFIDEETKNLSQEFTVFRAALTALADKAPEVHTLTTEDVLRMGLGDIGKYVDIYDTTRGPGAPSP